MQTACGRDNTEQAEMTYFHCDPSRYKKKILLEQQEEYSPKKTNKQTNKQAVVVFKIIKLMIRKKIMTIVASTAM